MLADIDAGHWIRYHSECSVIGDVFLLTPLHAAKALESARLLRLTPAELVAESRDIRYVFARHSTGLFLNESGREAPDLNKLRGSLPALERELLAPDAKLPPQYRMRGEARTPGGQVYARLYEIDRGRESGKWQGDHELERRTSGFELLSFPVAHGRVPDSLEHGPRRR